MAWGVEGFVVSFIAPHSLTARALVVAPERPADGPQPLAGAGRHLGRRAPGRRARPGRAMQRRVRARGGRPRPAAGRVVLPPAAREVRPPLVKRPRRRRRSSRGAAPRSLTAGAVSRIERLGGAAIRSSVAMPARPTTYGREPASLPSRGRRSPARTSHELCQNCADAGPSVGAAGTPSACSSSCASRTSCSSSGPSCASRPGSTSSRARPARARPCSPTRSTCCSAAARAPASCAPAPRRPTSRASSSCRRRCARSWATGCRPTPRSSCSPAGSAPRAARGPTWAAAPRRSPTCARSARALLAFYGQHEHRKLTLASVAARDARRLLRRRRRPARRAAFAAALRGGARARGELEELRERAGARDRELDLLEFELQEIEAADPVARTRRPSCAAERERLRHLEALRAARAGRGARRSAPDEGDGACRACWPRAARALDGVDGVDPALDALAERWRALAVEADDLAGELRRYGEGIEGEPGALEEVEERLAVLDRLKRKHGGTIAAVLGPRRALPRPARRARRRRGGARARRGARSRRRARELPQAAAALRAARAKAAPRLAARGARARSPRWRWRARASRSRCGEREPGPDGRRRGRVPASRRTRACPPARCARSPRAASSRA